MDFAGVVVNGLATGPELKVGGVEAEVVSGVFDGTSVGPELGIDREVVVSGV